MERSPTKLLCQLAQQTGLSYSTCQKAVNKLYQRRYRAQVGHELHEANYGKRVQYGQWFNNHINNNETLDICFFLGEAWFEERSLDGRKPQVDVDLFVMRVFHDDVSRRLNYAEFSLKTQNKLNHLTHGSMLHSKVNSKVSADTLNQAGRDRDIKCEEKEKKEHEMRSVMRVSKDRKAVIILTDSDEDEVENLFAGSNSREEYFPEHLDETSSNNSLDLPSNKEGKFVENLLSEETMEMNEEMPLSEEFITMKKYNNSQA
ncbi:hypothetical protein ILUMI_01522 [Ignelater luminosus]|uniref:Uncharacterized protein n=1 Tax=Ignelater luminosus TaxID=2038154 RepID=A0A8K0DE86_IGNLU|nr:hypothetical protein ILUMI_01522 [Ignelater luminosus]